VTDEGRGGLTDAERRALELTAELMRWLADEVIGDGPEREADLREVAHRVHAVQHMIMAQSAARAHPELYRPLGGGWREGCLRP
jgi:hypothetical protein